MRKKNKISKFTGAIVGIAQEQISIGDAVSIDFKTGKIRRSLTKDILWKQNQKEN